MDLFEKAHAFQRPNDLRAVGLYPYFTPIQEFRGATRVVVNGRELIMAGSNNYLGLTHDDHVLDACHQALDEFGSGCTGSRFLNGTLELHLELESRLAAFFEKDACITASTGYQSALGAIATLANRRDSIYGDKFNHASIIDGCRLSGAHHTRFQHNDARDLRRQLESRNGTGGGGKLVVTEGIFSTLGDLAPLDELIQVSERFGCRFMLDDAHGVGVLGKGGRGAAEHFGILDKVDLIVGTFSKSFACLGGFVAGPATVIDYIKNTSRSVMFSASMTPANVAAAIASLDIIENQPERRQALHRVVATMKNGFQELGFEVIGGDGAILAIVIGEQMETMEFNRRLMERGVLVNPIIPPAVPSNMCMLRTSYSAVHSDEELEAILNAFSTVGEEMGILGRQIQPV
jgi:8-amino-7-oxononanoate synthase